MTPNRVVVLFGMAKALFSLVFFSDSVRIDTGTDLFS